MSYNPRIDELERKVDAIPIGGEVPVPSGLSDAGKVVSVNETGTGYELTEPVSGGAIVLYPTEDVAVVSGLPEEIPVGAVWEVDPESTNAYVSYSPNGTALTYGELKNVLLAAKNGTAVITVYTPEEGVETFYPTFMYTSGLYIGENEGFASISMSNYNDVVATYDYIYTTSD